MRAPLIDRLERLHDFLIRDGRDRFAADLRQAIKRLRAAERIAAAQRDAPLW